MTSEQLQAARAAHWRQKQSPVFTLDDAQSWFQQHPLCLYLPRHAQLPAPAPSFVEACVGSRQPTPGAEALQHAQALLIRLVATHTVVPLNLFGTVSEQPDFLAHTDALPAVLSLRADSDWKHAPQKSSGHAVSPLVLELWKALEKEGSLTASEARQALGRELTEAAVLRGLCELWQSLRISPVFPAEGEPARWEMLRVHHRAALATAGATGQVTAISLLVSMYLQSVYAASSDEIEIFLSPVASRSRVREAVRGLAATRQIQSLSMDAQTYYFLEGGLPEFAEAPASAPAEGVVGAPAAPRRPLPAPRKVQATRPVGSPAPPAAGAAPIFRRLTPAVPPVMRPERPPFRPAAHHAATAPDRQGGRPAAKPYHPKSSAPPAAERSTRPSSSPPRRPYVPGSAGGDRRPGQASPRNGQRNAQQGAAAPFARSRSPYPRPGTAAAKAGGPPRPAARGDARPGAWKGGATRDTPKPWALPGRKSGAPPRPPRPGGRSDVPFRKGKEDAGRRPADAGSGQSEHRPQRAPFPGRANRPAGSSAANTGYRKYDRPRPAGSGASRGARPDTRPGKKPEERGEPKRPYRPRPAQAGDAARPSWTAKPRSGGSKDRPGGSARPPFVAGRASRSGGKPPANLPHRKPNDRGPNDGKPNRKKPAE